MVEVLSFIIMDHLSDSGYLMQMLINFIQTRYY